MKLYIVRHGQTQWNVERRMQGCKNSPLTELGIENAKMLGERLKDINFDMVYTSPLGRTLQTVESIFQGRTCPLEKRDELKEMYFGNWEGMKFEEVQKVSPEQYDNFWNHPENYKVVNNGETFEDVRLRVGHFLDYVQSHKDYENVLIITHTCIIKTIYSIVYGHDVSQFWSDPVLHDTCLSIIDTSSGSMKFILEADMSHIKNFKCTNSFAK